MEPSKSVFFKTKTSKRGVFYVTDKFGGIDGEVKATIGSDDTLSITTPEGTELIAPKSNQYGNYYLAVIGGQKYFVSERENDRGSYLMAKPAPEKKDLGGRAERPATYGGRQ